MKKIFFYASAILASNDTTDKLFNTNYGNKFTTDEISILKELEPKITQALETSKALANNGITISEQLRDSNSVQIIPYLFADATPSQVLSRGFRHVSYLAILPDYSVVLKFKNIQDYDSGRNDTTTTGVINNYLQPGDTINESYSADPSALHIPNKIYYKLMNTQIVWIPKIKPNNLTESTINSSNYTTSTLPTNPMITDFVAYSNIGQQCLSNYILFHASDTTHYSKPEYINSVSIENSLEKYRAQYDSINDVPEALFYDTKETFDSNSVFLQYRVKWMPSDIDLLNQSDVSPKYSFNKVQNNLGTNSVTTDKLGVSVTLPDQTYDRLIAWNFIKNENYINHFYSWKPNLLDNMRESAKDINQITTFDQYYKSLSTGTSS